LAEEISMTYAFTDPTTFADDPLGGTTPTHTEVHGAEEDAIVDIDARLLVLEAQPINEQTDDYDLVITDVGKLVKMHKSTAVELTVPPFSDVAFAPGQRVDIVASNTGQVTVVEGSGVTVNVPPTKTRNLTERWSMASLVNLDEDVWVLTGDLELA
jgi:hypothetical protein